MTNEYIRQRIALEAFCQYNLAKMDRERFLAYVRDALNHLNDHLYLDTHPLAAIIHVASGSGQPGTTRRVLVDCVHAMRPAMDQPIDSPSSRRYRYLELRYLEGLGPRDVARELNVSPRQCQRDQRDAIEALGSILWGRYKTLVEKAGQTSDSVDPGLEDPSLARRMALETEFWRLTREREEKPTPFGEIVQRAVALALPLAQARQVRFKLAVPTGLPPIAVDGNALRHGLLSLLNHAIESSHDGLVTISAASKADLVRLDVTFHLGPENVSASPGSEPSVTESDNPLLVVKPFIEMQGGRLESRSDLSGEAIVSFILPIAEVMTVLVIDDNPDAIRLIERYLERGPFRVLHASTAERALQIAQQIQPDAITLDLLMPLSDGLEILQTLKSDPFTRDIPVIVCSVFREKAVALSLGASAFLAKPFKPEDLLDALRTHATPRFHSPRPDLLEDTAPTHQPKVLRSE